MTAITLRELHEQTAHWVRKATAQEPIVLIDNDEPIAQIVPLPGSSVVHVAQKAGKRRRTAEGGSRNSVEERARRGSVEKLREALDRVPPRPPPAGDKIE